MYSRYLIARKNADGIAAFDGIREWRIVLILCTVVNREPERMLMVMLLLMV